MLSDNALLWVNHTNPDPTPTPTLSLTLSLTLNLPLPLSLTLSPTLNLTLSLTRWVNHSARFGLGLNGDARTTYP